MEMMTKYFGIFYVNFNQGLAEGFRSGFEEGASATGLESSLARHRGRTLGHTFWPCFAIHVLDVHLGIERIHVTVTGVVFCRHSRIWCFRMLQIQADANIYSVNINTCIYIHMHVCIHVYCMHILCGSLHIVKGPHSKSHFVYPEVSVSPLGRILPLQLHRWHPRWLWKDCSLCQSSMAK